MHQEYSEEDDIRHIRSLLPVFEDKRYIRVNGKPLFLVYRTDSIPDPARTAEIWREEARQAGVGELYLCRVESFVKSDPHEIGFDAGVSLPRIGGAKVLSFLLIRNCWLGPKMILRRFATTILCIPTRVLRRP